MSITATQRLELLRLARDNASALLKGLQREAPTVKGFGESIGHGIGEGEQVFSDAIDAAANTLDNLNRALQGGSSK